MCVCAREHTRAHACLSKAFGERPQLRERGSLLAAPITFFLGTKKVALWSPPISLFNKEMFAGMGDRHVTEP